MFNMYAIYDRVAKEYNYPFCAKNDDCALRMVKNSKVPNLDEYKLFKLGTFDVETGILSPVKLEEISIV